MNFDDECVYEDSGNETSGDDVDFGVDADDSSNTNLPPFEEEYQYEVLATEQIVQHMNDCIREVNTVVQIPSTTTRILLNYFKWDKEKLMERFYDGNQEELFKEAHVISPYKKAPVAGTTSAPQTKNTKEKEKDKDKEKESKNEKDKKEKKGASRSSGSAVAGREECAICFMVLPPSELTGLECGHRFCFHCWNEYLTTKIMEEGVGQTIACAAHQCSILVDDQTVMRLVKDSRVRLKYQQLITNSFVECNRLMRWCPSPDCTFALKVSYLFQLPIAFN